MPLIDGKLPDDVDAAMRKEFDHRLVARGHLSPLLGDIPLDKVFLAAPHRTAVLGRQAVLKAGPIRSRAVMTGWRILVQHDHDVVAAVELGADRDGTFRINRINTGPAAQGTEQAVRLAEQDAAILGGDFELIFLMVPELFVVAIWLCDPGGIADRFSPIPPLPKEFKAAHGLLTDDAFSAALRGILGLAAT